MSILWLLLLFFFFGGLFFFGFWMSSYASIIYLLKQTIIAPLNCLFFFSEYQLTILACISFWTLYSVPFIHFSVLSPIKDVDYPSFIVRLEVRYSYFLLLQHCAAYLGLFVEHMYFRINLLIYDFECHSVTYRSSWKN